MTPRDELLAVFDRWHRKVDGLRVWSGGESRLHDLLLMAVWPRTEGARRGVEVVDFPWETLVDRVSQWHFDHAFGTGEYSLIDVRDAVQAASESTRVEPLERAIQADAFQVRKTGGAFRVTYRWDVSLEVADMYLERQVGPAVGRGQAPGHLQRLSVATRDPPDGGTAHCRCCRGVAIRAAGATAA
jgi:hypothetical protein